MCTTHKERCLMFLSSYVFIVLCFYRTISAREHRPEEWSNTAISRDPVKSEYGCKNS